MFELGLLLVVLVCVCGYGAAMQAKLNDANRRLLDVEEALIQLGRQTRGIGYNIPLMLEEALRKHDREKGR